jgi:sporulation protein YlmC with PRC-barrel domain
MELSGTKTAFSELIGVKVFDQSGRSLGRVFEVRGHWERSGTIVVDELLVGGKALRRRLRGPGPHSHGIPWQAVSAIESDRIVIHG